MPRVAAVVVLLALVLPTVAAAVDEVALPEGSHPLALAFAPDGKLWVTLDGPWALGEFDPATGNLTLHPLAAPKAREADPQTGAPGDSLFALRLGPDGAWWTASQTHLHRVDPGTGNASAWPLPEATQLAGDVAFAGGDVLVALVTADAVGVFTTATAAWTTVATAERFGPLHFTEVEASRVGVVGTYAGEVATLDLATRAFVGAAVDGLQGPVGVVAADATYTVAEMGSSSVARDGEGPLVRYPTSPSPFYPSSGPSDVALVGGKVWFVEHFADRVGLLDPANGTLVEWMAPSAPGTNMQRLAVGPDGRAWFAEWSADRLGWVRDDVAHRFPVATPDRVTLAPGTEVDVKLDVPVASVGSVTPGLTGRATSDGVKITASPDAATGQYLLLASTGARPYLEGRYVPVTIQVIVEDPSLGVLAVLAAVVLVARWRR